MKRIVFAVIAIVILLAVHAIIPDSLNPIDTIVVVIAAYAYGKWIEKKALSWRRNRI